jgi:hypothetical protein
MVEDPKTVFGRLAEDPMIPYDRLVEGPKVPLLCRPVEEAVPKTRRVHLEEEVPKIQCDNRNREQERHVTRWRMVVDCGIDCVLAETSFRRADNSSFLDDWEDSHTLASAEALTVSKHCSNSQIDPTDTCHFQ